ncbi:MAG: glycosyltransferase family 2 protein [Tildeniella nuda ZEHNDER 1965/U140]|jgi:hypothetical protein|nr:glycosyltransferase family 2 protein [Tildeniella nuda ZEHNDER 1965/U140]
MSEHSLDTPVALFIFNRPHLTQKVFNAIRQAKPSRLLVIADGPRSDRVSEAELCIQSRAVIEQVDWQCQILTNFSETNMGCKRRISSGLNWVFDTVEEAIILEDDCLPHPTFFPFCEALLNYYRDDTRIMVISGGNFQFGHKRTNDSYYFSRYNHCWGWASWRRAWRYYDVDMSLWSTVKQGSWLHDLLGDDRTVQYWTEMLEAVSCNRIDTWDYQWTFACWIQHGLSILPNVNLVSNIGFGTNATHTTEINQFSNLVTAAMQFPLKHPAFVIQDVKADNLTHQRIDRENRLAKLNAAIKHTIKRLA